MAKVATTAITDLATECGGGHGELLTLVDGRGWGRIDSDTRKSPSGKKGELFAICEVKKI